jgi:tetratricopeptide (TPR) repeat protein
MTNTSPLRFRTCVYCAALACLGLALHAEPQAPDAAEPAETAADAEVVASPQEKAYAEVTAFRDELEAENKEDFAALAALQEKYRKALAEKFPGGMPPPLPPGADGIPPGPPEMPKPSAEDQAAAAAIVERVEARRTRIVERFDRFLADFPEAWKEIDDFAWYLYTHGSAKRSRELWLRAIEIKPDEPEPHNNLGIWCSHYGEPLRAVDEFRVAIGLNSEEADYHFNLATVYFTSRHVVAEREGWDLPTVFWKSQAAYERAFELEPDNFEFAKNSFQNFIAARHFDVENVTDKEIAACRRCLDLDLEPAQRSFVLTHLGRVYSKLGRRDEARRALEAALEAHPTSAARHLLSKLADGGG